MKSMSLHTKTTSCNPNIFTFGIAGQCGCRYRDFIRKYIYLQPRNSVSINLHFSIMRRLSTVVLFVMFTQYVTTTASTVYKDVEEVGAIEKIDVPIPETPAVAQPNTVTDDLKCAQIGEPCIFHGDCCSRACLGYAKRCVT